MLLFLDCCCFNRPFDDLSQIRVRLEAETVEWILEESQTGRFTVVTSDYLTLELLRNPDPTKRANTLATTAYSGLHVPTLESVSARASTIENLGITGFDALHVAAAEAAGCDYLVTTDDRLLKKGAPEHLVGSRCPNGDSNGLRDRFVPGPKPPETRLAPHG